MNRRIDALLVAHPEHADDIRLLAERDPAGNLKYLAWAVTVLLSGRALAPEIADVVDLFHKFSRSSPVRALHYRHYRRRSEVLRHDLYSYKPHEFTVLRDTLFKLRAAQDKKRRKIEQRYRIVGDCDSEIVYESDALLVRQIKNKQASVHYGLGTKWCITMKSARYFEDYDGHNTVFFFLARKQLRGDALDRVAVAFSRDVRNEPTELNYYDMVDEPVERMRLMRCFGGSAFFAVEQAMYDRAVATPISRLAALKNGAVSAEDAAHIYETVQQSPRASDAASTLLALACNAETPADILVAMLRDGERLLHAAALDPRRRRRRRRPRRWMQVRLKQRLRDLRAAVFVHPATPSDLRVAVGKQLRRQNVRTESITIRIEDAEVGVRYQPYRGRERQGRLMRWRRYRADSVAGARRRLAWAERQVTRCRRRLDAAERKSKKKKKGKR